MIASLIIATMRLFSLKSTRIAVLVTALATTFSWAKELPQEVIRNTSREIDRFIQTANSTKGINANPIVDDATFLRRSYLNIIGRIPTYQETQQFLDSTSADKRAELIDQLVYSKGFNSKLFNFYANLLRLQTNQEQFGAGWHLWLKNSIKQNKPYDELVHEMLSANGHSVDNPAVGYYLRDRNMLLDNISNTTKIFLGTQIGCAQCHDDPFEDWTQKQYYELAAFGAEIDYNKGTKARSKLMEIIALKTKNVNLDTSSKKSRNKLKNLRRQTAREYSNIFRSFRKNEISLQPNKQLTLPEDYQYNDGNPGDKVSPAVLFGTLPKLDSDTPKQEQFASWVTSRENPMFSKVIANRLWKHALGYGLVEPVDNWTEHSNCSHPEVLDTLVKILHATDFDTRETLRVIYHTAVFQRATCLEEINDGRTHDFRGPLLRRLSAEEIHDSLVTLESGNIDNNENHALEYQWGKLEASIESLMNASPQELIALAQATSRFEESTRNNRLEINKAKQRLAEVTAEGDPVKIKKVKAQLGALAAEYRKLKKANQPKDEMASMMVMRKVNVRGSKLPLRSSEQSSPFSPGSFARDFGASDRQTTNAQHTHASVPQALTMLNGTEITNLTDHKGNLATLLKKADNHEQRLEILFLAIYNARPTAAERQQLLPLLSSLQDVQILAKAMLNSKRFFFVQ